MGWCVGLAVLLVYRPLVGGAPRQGLGGIRTVFTERAPPVAVVASLDLVDVFEAIRKSLCSFGTGGYGKNQQPRLTASTCIVPDDIGVLDIWQADKALMEPMISAMEGAMTMQVMASAATPAPSQGVLGGYNGSQVRPVIQISGYPGKDEPVHAAGHISMNSGLYEVVSEYDVVAVTVPCKTPVWWLNTRIEVSELLGT